jgi:hypothetical protein
MAGPVRSGGAMEHARRTSCRSWRCGRARPSRRPDRRRPGLVGHGRPRRTRVGQPPGSLRQGRSGAPFILTLTAQHVKMPALRDWVGAVTMLMGATAWGLVLAVLAS